MNIGKCIIRTLMWRLRGALILVFHHVTDSPDLKMSSCILATNKFDDLVNKYSGYFISLNTLLKKKVILPRGIVITFDDGLEDVYTVAYPILKSRNIPFTVFIVYNFLDTPGYITTEQLQEMAGNPIVTVGVHGMTHRVLTKLSSEEKKIEIVESKFILEKLLRKRLDLFAYSHGQYDGECLSLVKFAGYQSAFVVQSRPYNIITGRFRRKLPRISVTQGSWLYAESIIPLFLKDRRNK